MGCTLRGPFPWLVFRHILSFAQSLVDRAHAWGMSAKDIQYHVTEKALLDSVVSDTAQGAVFLVSHLGNFDLAMKGSNITSRKRFNIVLSSKNSAVFNRFRFKFMESDQVRFVEASDITTIGIINLVERVSEGEIVVIAADRTVDDTNRSNVPVTFLDETAMFPAGPYILAHMLGVPVYTLFTFKQRDVCLVLFQLFENKVNVSRHDRQTAIHCYAQKFATILECNCLQYPLQWYNFYDFWAK